MFEKLIVMINDLGHGHKGDIIITTQERVDKNFPPIAKNIINEAYAMAIIDAFNSINTIDKIDMSQLFLGVKYDKNETMWCSSCKEKFIITPEESEFWDTTCKRCGLGLVIREEEIRSLLE